MLKVALRSFLVANQKFDLERDLSFFFRKTEITSKDNSVEVQIRRLNNMGTWRSVERVEKLSIDYTYGHFILCAG